MKEVSSDINIATNLLINDSGSFKNFSWDLRNNEKFALFAISLNPINFFYVSENLKSSKDFVIKVLKSRISGNPFFTASKMLGFMNKELRDDEEVVKYAVSLSPFNFEYASSRLTDSEKFVKEIMKLVVGPTLMISFILECCSDRLRNDKNFILDVMDIDPIAAINGCSKTLLLDNAIINKICSINNLDYNNLNPDIKNNREFFEKLFSKNGFLLIDTPMFIEDKELVLVALNTIKKEFKAKINSYNYNSKQARYYPYDSNSEYFANRVAENELDIDFYTHMIESIRELINLSSLKSNPEVVKIVEELLVLKAFEELRKIENSEKEKLNERELVK